MIYSLSKLEEKDLELIKNWRNEQINVLRQRQLLTDEDQKKYWKSVIEPSYSQQHPQQLLFGFYHKNYLIGYGGLTHIDWEARRAEVSFLVATERRDNPEQYSQDFSAFLPLLLDIAFNQKNLHRLYTETYDLRPDHIAILEDFGFKLEGRLKDHVKIGDRYVDSLIHGYVKS